MRSTSRMFLTLGALLFGGFLLTSTVSYLISRETIRQTILKDELPLSSDNIYSEIQRDLFEPILISSLMANDTFVEDWLQQGEKKPEEIMRYLAQIKSRYGTITSFLVSNSTHIYYQAGGILKTVHEDEPDDAWYFRVRDMKPDYEINVDPDKANRDAMTIFINYRVLDDNGRFLGATGVGLTVNAVKELMRSYRLKFNREIYFYDLNGDLILHSHPESEVKMTKFPHDDSPALQEIRDRVARGEKETTFSAVGNSGAMANYRFIPELDWILVVEQTSDGTAPIFWKTFATNLAICLLTAGFLLGIIRVTILRYQARLESHNHQLQEQNGRIEKQADELREVNRKLDAMHREKDEFIGITVHDLKNPLCSVLGFSELLLADGSITGERRDSLSAIHVSSMEMLAQVEDLLQLTELEASPAKIVLKDVDAAAVVRDVARDYSYHAAAKQTPIILNLPERPCLVQARENWLRSVVSNLVSNAIKYSPSGATIEVCLRQHNQTTEIAIQDHGQGIPIEEQERLFKKYERLSTRPTAGESSSGLGLYIVKQIMNRLNGRVWCESAPGQGSTFTISLPSASGEEGENQRPGVE